MRVCVGLVVTERVGPIGYRYLFQDVSVINKKRRCYSCDDDSDDDTTLCLVCCELYSYSRPGEKWIQCSACKGWAHVSCTNGSAQYLCANCDSDDSE